MSKKKRKSNNPAKSLAKTGAQNGNKASNHAVDSPESTNTVSKMKRFLSLTGVVLLLALYLLTFILAIADNSASLQLFYASVVATILIPILIWGYTLIYRLFNKENKEDNRQGT